MKKWKEINADNRQSSQEWVMSARGGKTLCWKRSSSAIIMDRMKWEREKEREKEFIRINDMKKVGMAKDMVRQLKLPAQVFMRANG